MCYHESAPQHLRSAPGKHLYVEENLCDPSVINPPQADAPAGASTLLPPATDADQTSDYSGALPLS
jgi:hypothetical protein